MDAKEFFRERERMLNAFGRTGGKCDGVSCDNCPLHQDERGCWDTEETVDIVEAWSKENPKKTYLSVLLEAFPNATLDSNGVPYICLCRLGFNGGGNCANTPCIDCWNREYKEADND